MWDEAEGVAELLRRVRAVCQAASGYAWQIVTVDDGSSDATHARLLELLPTFASWKLLKLSRNFGQQPAYRAGLDAADGRAVIFLDADLQDPPELIPQLLAEWEKGAKLVTACRRSRQETGLRRALFDAFHRIFFRLTGGVMPKDSGTYALMDRIVADHLKAMPERNLFLPALRGWIGHPQATVLYDRQARAAGEPKQSFSRLLNYAWDGITSFSDLPLKAISLIGLLISFAGLSYGLLLVVIRILQFFGWFRTLEIQGFTTLAVAVFCLGGIQLLCLGIIGEYLARIYRETKKRPHYILESVAESPRQP